MAPSFDYAVSSLLCAEDNTSIFDEVDDSYEAVLEGDFDEICNWRHGNPHDLNININNNNNHQDKNFDYFSGFSVPSDECLASLFDKERQHFLGLDYLKRLRSGDLDLGARNQAIDWILKVQSYYNFGPLCACLSVNYLDRFLSAYELPGKAWMMQLLAVACLSLAAKLDETDVPLSLDLQVGEANFVFEAKSIQAMELLVLSTLEWRMQAVTPLSFMDYYLYKLNGDKMPPRSVTFQAIQLTLSTIKEIDLLEFRPSEIAAAVAISATQETTVELSDKAFSFITDQVEKERTIKCVETMHEMRMSGGMNNGGVATMEVPQSPSGVLDAACMSYKSSDDDASTTTPTGSCANSVHSSPASSSAPPPDPKRRKLDNMTLI